MTALRCLFAAIVIAPFIIGYLLYKAPVGYEDEKGFRYGKPIELRKRGMRD